MTDYHHRLTATGSATGVCALRVESTRVHGPLAVSRLRQVSQHKRSPNQTNKTNKTNKTNSSGGASNRTNSRGGASNRTNRVIETNKKTTVRLTNKQRIESKLLNLTLDVHALQEELRSLHTYRTILHSRVLLAPQAADGSIVQTARQYFHVFRRGYRVTDAVGQFAFLQAVTDDALSMGTTGLGRTMLFEQWRRYAEYFAFRFLTPPVLRVITTDADETCIVRCETTLNGSFTWQALEMVFPAAKRDSQLMQQLLGREMVTPMCFHLHFDRQGRMVRHDFEADFLSALQHALKDPVRAAKIVEDAKFAEEGMVEAIVEPNGPTEACDAVVTKTRVKGKSLRRRRDDEEHEDVRKPEAVDAEENDERLSVKYLLS